VSSSCWSCRHGRAPHVIQLRTILYPQDPGYSAWNGLIGARDPGDPRHSRGAATGIGGQDPRVKETPRRATSTCRMSLGRIMLGFGCQFRRSLTGAAATIRSLAGELRRYRTNSRLRLAFDMRLRIRSQGPTCPASARPGIVSVCVWDSQCLRARTATESASQASLNPLAARPHRFDSCPGHHSLALVSRPRPGCGGGRRAELLPRRKAGPQRSSL